MEIIEKFKNDLHNLGIKKGDSIMMHCSYKSLGEKLAPNEFFDAFLEILGDEGTLVLPAFSYETVNYDNPFFDVKKTPSCVGFLPEYFRTTYAGTKRSVHATHSCSVIGKNADYLVKNHELDLTPVGENSPISKLPELNGKILILGSHPDHNTALHGVEEKGRAPYIFERDKTICYILRDGEREIKQNAIRHNFRKETCYYEQKYSRILDVLSKEDYSFGKVLYADCYLMDAKAVWEKGVKKLIEEPYYFVNKISDI